MCWKSISLWPQLSLSVLFYSSVLPSLSGFFKYAPIHGQYSFTPTVFTEHNTSTYLSSQPQFATTIFLKLLLIYTINSWALAGQGEKGRENFGI